MPQITVNLNEEENYKVDIVKAKNRLKNKAAAIKKIIGQHQI